MSAIGKPQERHIRRQSGKCDDSSPPFQPFLQAGETAENRTDPARQTTTPDTGGTHTTRVESLCWRSTYQYGPSPSSLNVDEPSTTPAFRQSPSATFAPHKQSLLAPNPVDGIQPSQQRTSSTSSDSQNFIAAQRLLRS